MDDVSREEYEKALRVMRRNMPHRIRSAYDPEDFVQQACLEIITEHVDPKLLVHISMHRMKNAYHRHDCKKRVPHVEIDEIEAIQPAPEKHVEASEMLDMLIMKAGDSESRTMVILAMQGHSKVEIAHQLQVMPYIVKRTLADLRKRT